MTELFSIPTKYKEGVYDISAFTNFIGNVINFEHDEYGDTLTYEIPSKDNDYRTKDGYREIVLYGIPKEEFRTTLSVFYDANGLLEKITAKVKNIDTLLYIHFVDSEAAKQEIKNFAISNAKSIVEKICTCKDVIARLFIEFYSDGDYMDFHAKLGTAAQKAALEKEYPNYDTDNAGNFSSEIIEGNNMILETMVICAECIGDDEINFFQYAVDIMSKYVEENAVEKLQKTDDFEFICSEYD